MSPLGKIEKLRSDYELDSFAAGAITHAEATERVKKVQARDTIPIVLLARLAVDKTFQGRGIGPALLKDALIRTAGAADTIEARALLVHAKDLKRRIRP